MRRLVVFLLLVGVCVCALAQQVKVYPRIETGTHTARVNRIGVDAAQRFLFSVSDDKTARLWDLHSGKLLKVLRPPIGDGKEGELFAVASSPDEAEVAVGGFTEAEGSGKFPVYIFDRESGAIRKTIPGLPQTARYLAYSKDGRYLAVAFKGQHGIRIYKGDGSSEVARDEKYGDSCYSLEFDQSGRLVTASDDGSVRLYSSDFRLLHKERPPGGTDPMSARFSPDGKLVAVGFDDTTAVDVLSGNDLSFLYALQTPQGGNLANTLWSADGQTVCAAGKYRNSNAVYPVLCWSDAGKGKQSAFPAGGDTIQSILPLRDGGIAFCEDSTVGVLGRTGVARWQSESDRLDYRRRDFPRVSSNGNNVEVMPFYFDGTEWTGRKISFSLADEKLEIDSESTISLQGATTSDLAIDSWENALHPTLDGRALQLDAYEMSRSLAISPNKDSFVLGTEWYIRKFDARGTPIWSSPIPGVAWGVNITADEQFVTATLNDGTVRWYTFDKGGEVLALFVDRDLQRWVAWNPDGFFTFKDGGDALIGYQINHGPDAAGEFIKVDQLRKVFYRADLIDQVLKPDGAAKVLAARNRVGDISQVLSSGLPPEIESISVAPTSDPDNYLVQFRVKDLGGGHGRIVYRIDGAEIEGRVGRGEVEVKGAGNDTNSRLISVGPGEHELSITAFSGNGKIESRPIKYRLTGRQATGRANLYVVAAGISHYSDHSMDDGVTFAAQDAESIAAKFREQEGKGLYQKVSAIALPDSRATAKGIQDAVAQLATKVKPEDTFVLYLAGHGTAEHGEYYFIPWEAEYTNLAEQLKKSLSGEAIQGLLAKIPTSKSALILDTCGSGQIVTGRGDEEKKTIEKVAIISGHAVLAASNSDKMALDGYQGHGVFTFFLLQGLDAADSDPQGTVLITRLAEYVQTRVPEITTQKYGYRQVPLSSINGEPFPIAQHKPAH